jgi:hypothetical protein
MRLRLSSHPEPWKGDGNPDNPWVSVALPGLHLIQTNRNIIDILLNQGLHPWLLTRAPFGAGESHAEEPQREIPSISAWVS